MEVPADGAELHAASEGCEAVPGSVARRSIEKLAGDVGIRLGEVLHKIITQEQEHLTKLAGQLGN